MNEDTSGSSPSDPSTGVAKANEPMLDSWSRRSLVIFRVLISLLVITLVGWYVVARSKCAIHRAAYRGDMLALRAEIERGASLERECDIGLPWTEWDRHMVRRLRPLHYAVRGDSADAVSALLAAGASPNAGDFLNFTPLDYAAMEGSSAELAALLLDAGADPNASGGASGWTPLHWAAWLNGDLVELLLEAGADPHVRGKFGGVPLHMSSSEAGTRALLRYGTDPNVRDDRGETPLTFAVGNRDWSSVRVLLEHGADPSIPDDDGESPADLATRLGYSEVFEAIRREVAPSG